MTVVDHSSENSSWQKEKNFVNTCKHRNLELEKLPESEMKHIPGQDLIFQFFNFILLSPSMKFSFCLLMSIISLMFNFSASQLTP